MSTESVWLHRYYLKICNDDDDDNSLAVHDRNNEIDQVPSFKTGSEEESFTCHVNVIPQGLDAHLESSQQIGTSDATSFANDRKNETNTPRPRDQNNNVESDDR